MSYVPAFKPNRAPYRTHPRSKDEILASDLPVLVASLGEDSWDQFSEPVSLAIDALAQKLPGRFVIEKIADDYMAEKDFRSTVTPALFLFKDGYRVDACIRPKPTDIEDWLLEALSKPAMVNIIDLSKIRRDAGYSFWFRTPAPVVKIEPFLDPVFRAKYFRKPLWSRSPS